MADSPGSRAGRDPRRIGYVGLRSRTSCLTTGHPPPALVILKIAETPRGRPGHAVALDPRNALTLATDELADRENPALARTHTSSGPAVYLLR